jgi:hypothetical protein
MIEDPFRKYGSAIAWLEWQDDCHIKKLETLKPRGGGATCLLLFLKGLAVKHGIRIIGNPIVYPPTCPLAAESPLSQEGLENLYSKCGYSVGRGGDGFPYVRYPDVPWVNERPSA